MQGTLLKLSFQGTNSHQTTDTQIVELKLTPVHHSGGSCLTFVVKPLVRKKMNVRTNVIDDDSFKVQHPYLEPFPLKNFKNRDVDVILGQNMFHSIHPLEYFETDRKHTPIASRFPLAWVLSGPLPSTSSLFSTVFKVSTHREIDSKLADQNRSWHDI